MVTETGPGMGVEAESRSVRAVMKLARAMKNVSFYEVGHPVVQEVMASVHADLTELLGEGSELHLKLISGYLVVQDVPLLSQHASIGNLVGACHRRGVEAIVLQRGVTREEVKHLVTLLATDPAAVEEAGGMAGSLTARGVRRITIERLQSASDLGWRWVHASALDVMRGAARSARTGEALDVGSIRLTAHDIVGNIMGDGSIVHNLNSMKDTDEYTFVHALHVSILAVELARQLGLLKEQLEEMSVATMLHDIGKIFVPLAILRKPAALDGEEFAAMSRHPVDGAAVLAPEEDLPEAAMVVAFEHHVHMDHSGYPRLRRRRLLHLYSLMTGIADVYDALTTTRPYRAAMPPQEAVALMKREFQGRLEPQLLERFFWMLGPYPWGTLVRLSDQVFAVVTRPNGDDPEDPTARGIELGHDPPRVSEEMPLRELTEAESLEIVDPVSVGIDLPGLLHSLPGASGGGRPEGSPPPD